MLLMSRVILSLRLALHMKYPMQGIYLALHMLNIPRYYFYLYPQEGRRGVVYSFELKYHYVLVSYCFWVTGSGLILLLGDWIRTHTAFG